MRKVNENKLYTGKCKHAVLCRQNKPKLNRIKAISDRKIIGNYNT